MSEDIKMNDVFELPLTRKKLDRYSSDIYNNKGVKRFRSLFHDDARAIVHAVNTHDELVEQKDKLGIEYQNICTEMESLVSQLASKDKVIEVAKKALTQTKNMTERLKPTNDMSRFETTVYESISNYNEIATKALQSIEQLERGEG